MRCMPRRACENAYDILLPVHEHLMDSGHTVVFHCNEGQVRSPVGVCCSFQYRLGFEAWFAGWSNSLGLACVGWCPPPPPQGNRPAIGREPYSWGGCLDDRVHEHNIQSVVVVSCGGPGVLATLPCLFARPCKAAICAMCIMFLGMSLAEALELVKAHVNSGGYSIPRVHRLNNYEWLVRLSDACMEARSQSGGDDPAQAPLSIALRAAARSSASRELWNYRINSDGDAEAPFSVLRTFVGRCIRSRVSWSKLVFARLGTTSGFIRMWSVCQLVGIYGGIDKSWGTTPTCALGIVFELGVRGHV